jgi:hypothetical protein
MSFHFPSRWRLVWLVAFSLFFFHHVSCRTCLRTRSVQVKGIFWHIRCVVAVSLAQRNDKKKKNRSWFWDCVLEKKKAKNDMGHFCFFEMEWRRRKTKTRVIQIDIRTGSYERKKSTMAARNVYISWTMAFALYWCRMYVLAALPLRVLFSFHNSNFFSLFFSFYLFTSISWVTGAHPSHVK